MEDSSFIADLKLDFDPDALREKYQQERDKRVRADGNAQYVEVDGQVRPLSSTTRTSSPVRPASR